MDNIVGSSPLSALNMTNRTMAYAFVLVGIGATIFASSIFSMLSLSLLPEQSAFATFPVENGKIAFTSQRDGGVENPEIYVMNADGSGQTNISHNPLPDGFPNWSPVVYDGLKKGTHQFTVRSTDAAGNTGQDQFTWIGNPPEAVAAPGRQ